ncbi:hypothetical protein FPHYL_8641 [Fusarium phyllophilum]|uniref:Uncharacterized protein n=1 Tax=Fusarium phyllophilum TaxID=47803 RepID=A0A8H5JE92_9HYPO|nr:hypothetical protein FPHYL_8641 [Fusarium phyllophilum]
MDQDIEVRRNIDPLFTTVLTTTDPNQSASKEAVAQPTVEKGANIMPNFLTYPQLPTAAVNFNLSCQDDFITGLDEAFFPGTERWMSTVMPPPVNDQQLSVTLAENITLNPCQLITPGATKMCSTSDSKTEMSLPSSVIVSPVCMTVTQELVPRLDKRKQSFTEIQPLSAVELASKKRKAPAGLSTRSPSWSTGAQTLDSTSWKAGEYHQSDETTRKVQPIIRSHGNTAGRTERSQKSQYKPNVKEIQTLARQFGRSDLQCCFPETTREFRVQWYVSSIPHNVRKGRNEPVLIQF